MAPLDFQTSMIQYASINHRDIQAIHKDLHQVVEDFLAKAFAKTPKVSEDPHRQCTFSCAESGCLEVQSSNFKTGLQNRRVTPEGHLQQLVTLRPSTKMREAKMLQSTVSG